MAQYHLEIHLDHSSIQDFDINELQWHQWLNKWFEYLDLDLNTNKIYELNLRFTNDREIQVLNQQFRNQNKPTDVLSFAALEDDFPEIEQINIITLGDIIISVQTASKQAHLENHSLKIELAWLASHGLLHLLGWDHPDSDSLQEMLTIQSQLLESVTLKAPSVTKYFS